MNITSTNKTPGLTVQQARENLAAHADGQKAAFEPSSQTLGLLDSLKDTKQDFLVDSYIEAKQNLEKEKILGMDTLTAKHLGLASVAVVASLTAAKVVQSLGGGLSVPLTLFGVGASIIGTGCLALKPDLVERERNLNLVEGQNTIFKIAKNPLRKEDSKAAKVNRQQLIDGLRHKEGKSTQLFTQVKYRDLAKKLGDIPGETAADILTKLPDYNWSHSTLQSHIRDLVLEGTYGESTVPAREIPVDHAIEQLEKHQRGAHAQLDASKARRAGKVAEALEAYPDHDLLSAYEKCDDIVQTYDQKKIGRQIEAGLLATASGIGAFVVGNYLGLGAAAAFATGGLALAGQRILSHKQPENLEGMRAVASNTSSLLGWIGSPTDEKDGKAKDITRDELFSHLREQMVDASPAEVVRRMESEAALKKVIGSNVQEMWESALKNEDSSQHHLTALTKEILARKEVSKA